MPPRLCDTRRSDLGDDRSQITSTELRLGPPDGDARGEALGGDLAQVAAIAPELHPTRLRGSERLLRPLADHARLQLGDREHLAKHKLPDRTFDTGHVAELDGDASVRKRPHEVRVTGQPRDVGDDQTSAHQTAVAERGCELRPLLRLARPALDLGEAGNDLPVAAVEPVGDRPSLRLKPQAARALLRRADPVIEQEGQGKEQRKCGRAAAGPRGRVQQPGSLMRGWTSGPQRAKPTPTGGRRKALRSGARASIAVTARLRTSVTLRGPPMVGPSR